MPAPSYVSTGPRGTMQPTGGQDLRPTSPPLSYSPVPQPSRIPYGVRDSPQQSVPVDRGEVPAKQRRRPAREPQSPFESTYSSDETSSPTSPTTAPVQRRQLDQSSYRSQPPPPSFAVNLPPGPPSFERPQQPNARPALPQPYQDPPRQLAGYEQPARLPPRFDSAAPPPISTPYDSRSPSSIPLPPYGTPAVAEAAPAPSYQRAQALRPPSASAQYRDGPPLAPAPLDAAEASRPRSTRPYRPEQFRPATLPPVAESASPDASANLSDEDLSAAQPAPPDQPSNHASGALHRRPDDAMPASQPTQVFSPAPRTPFSTAAAPHVSPPRATETAYPPPFVASMAPTPPQSFIPVAASAFVPAPASAPPRAAFPAPSAPLAAAGSPTPYLASASSRPSAASPAFDARASEGHSNAYPPSNPPAAAPMASMGGPSAPPYFPSPARLPSEVAPPPNSFAAQPSGFQQPQQQIGVPTTVAPPQIGFAPAPPSFLQSEPQQLQQRPYDFERSEVAPQPESAQQDPYQPRPSTSESAPSVTPPDLAAASAGAGAGGVAAAGWHGGEREREQPDDLSDSSAPVETPAASDTDSDSDPGARDAPRTEKERSLPPLDTRPEPSSFDQREPVTTPTDSSVDDRTDDEREQPWTVPAGRRQPREEAERFNDSEDGPDPPTATSSVGGEDPLQPVARNRSAAPQKDDVATDSEYEGDNEDDRDGAPSRPLVEGRDSESFGRDSSRTPRSANAGQQVDDGEPSSADDVDQKDGVESRSRSGEPADRLATASGGGAGGFDSDDAGSDNEDDARRPKRGAIDREGDRDENKLDDNADDKFDDAKNVDEPASRQSKTSFRREDGEDGGDSIGEDSRANGGTDARTLSDEELDPDAKQPTRDAGRDDDVDDSVAPSSSRDLGDAAGDNDRTDRRQDLDGGDGYGGAPSKSPDLADVDETDRPQTANKWADKDEMADQSAAGDDYSKTNDGQLDNYGNGNDARQSDYRDDGLGGGGSGSDSASAFSRDRDDGYYGDNDSSLRNGDRDTSYANADRYNDRDNWSGQGDYDAGDQFADGDRYRGVTDEERNGYRDRDDGYDTEEDYGAERRHHREPLSEYGETDDAMHAAQYGHHEHHEHHDPFEEELEEAKQRYDKALWTLSRRARIRRAHPEAVSEAFFHVLDASYDLRVLERQHAEEQEERLSRHHRHSRRPHLSHIEPTPFPDAGLRAYAAHTDSKIQAFEHEQYSRHRRSEDELERLHARLEEHDLHMEERHLAHHDAHTTAEADGHRGPDDIDHDAADKEHDEALARVRKAQQNARRHPNSRQASVELAAAHRHLEDVEKQHDEQHQALADRHAALLKDPHAHPDEIAEALHDRHRSAVHRLHRARNKLADAQSELDAAEHARPSNERHVAVARRRVEAAREAVEDAEKEERDLRPESDPAHRQEMAALTTAHAAALVDRRRKELAEVENDAHASPEAVERAKERVKEAAEHHESAMNAEKQGREAADEDARDAGRTVVNSR
ncbi:uncharacterized protein JCM10292_001148 [Rhodotorula paludigena]|uniref:uncharacterized protein n=1 Tax=Rhodotorula paludigena TaxID=86838 RepID=UPI003177CB56